MPFTGKNKVEESGWQSLKQFTQARVALGRCGCSVPTREVMAFKLAHAKAMDAVQQPLAQELLVDALARLTGLECLCVRSAARDRTNYLQRPDLGRQLLAADAAKLRKRGPRKPFDIALVVADGLSSAAIEINIQPLLALLVPALQEKGFRLAPVAVVAQGRVAVADEVAALMQARMAIVFIGERPGLKSPNSLGIYMTYDAQPGVTDEQRNCISNVRPGGLSYVMAFSKLLYLVEEAFRRRLSGVMLKDEQEVAKLPHRESVLVQGKG